MGDADLARLVAGHDGVSELLAERLGRGGHVGWLDPSADVLFEWRDCADHTRDLKLHPHACANDPLGAATLLLAAGTAPAHKRLVAFLHVLALCDRPRTNHPGLNTLFDWVGSDDPPPVKWAPIAQTLSLLAPTKVDLRLVETELGHAPLSAAGEIFALIKRRIAWGDDADDPEIRKQVSRLHAARTAASHLWRTRRDREPSLDSAAELCAAITSSMELPRRFPQDIENSMFDEHGGARSVSERTDATLASLLLSGMAMTSFLVFAGPGAAFLRAAKEIYSDDLRRAQPDVAERLNAVDFPALFAELQGSVTVAWALPEETTQPWDWPVHIDVANGGYRISIDARWRSRELEDQLTHILVPVTRAAILLHAIAVRLELRPKTLNDRIGRYFAVKAAGITRTGEVREEMSKARWGRCQMLDWPGSSRTILGFAPTFDA